MRTAFAALGLLFVMSTLARADDVAPHRSLGRLVSSNGHVVVSYNRATNRVDTFLEHPYRFRSPNNAPADLCFSADETRDLAFDQYFGVRINGNGVWLPDVPATTAMYVNGTNIFYTEQFAGPDRKIGIVTHAFAPMTLDAPAMVMLVNFTNLGTAPLTVSPYALFNYHLGDAAGGREPSASGEEVSWDGARHTLYEYGPGQGTMAYVALSDLASTSTATGENGAYQSLLRGASLDGSTGTSGPTDDVAPGFEGVTATLQPNETIWFAVATVWAADEDAAPDVDRLQAWVDGRSPSEILHDESDAWATWIGELPSSVPVEDRGIYRQSLVVLRTAQVRESGSAFGQILASLPPGLDRPESTWNITWVRDMAYATAALARSGHLHEARDALYFQLHAPRGLHTAEVGMRYRISVTRYFGDGSEESDCNENGPNIEFDGFGLFLWSLGEYVNAGGDPQIFATDWPVIESEIGDVLASQIDSSGTIRADSSIWETHWNGQERRFAYTSITAARGLCDAAELATSLGHVDAAARFRAAGERVRDALLDTHTDSRGAIGQSVEDLLRGSGYIDAAAIEAVNFGLVRPDGRSARATFAAIRDNLLVPTGRGFMRNDDGGDYDSAEWVFVDLRLLTAEISSYFDDRASVLAWTLGQARANDNEFAELLNRDTGDYTGSMPMVGFGAGAFVLYETRMASQPSVACGSYAEEPPPPTVDGGTPDAGTATDTHGCSCQTTTSSRPNITLSLLASLALVAAFARRRRFS